MKRQAIPSLLGLLAFAPVFDAGAATVSLVPSSAQVATGSPFTVALLLNAADAPGTHPGLYSGDIVIDFDPALLTYVGYAPATGTSTTPVIGSADGHQTVTLDFDNVTDIATVGTFSFTAIGALGSIATIDSDADNFFGTYISHLPTNQPFYPTFVDTSVQVIPLPGTAWLLITAFGAVAARARRFARAGTGRK